MIGLKLSDVFVLSFKIKAISKAMANMIEDDVAKMEQEYQERQA